MKNGDLYMEIELIIQSIMGLLGLLAILVFLLFITPSSKPPEIKEIKPIKEVEPTISMNTDIESLRAIIKDKNSSAQELRRALELVIEYHGTVHTKLGVRPHPDFDIYAEILFAICRHPNADKDMVISFDRDLGRLNPEYKEDINEAITKGLNSRRV
jgi:hypothetical protein